MSDRYGTCRLKFLKRLIRLVRPLFFLIVERHPAHLSVEVARWLARNSKRIQMFFLPGYSPELNPDKLLNQDVKTNALGRRRPEDLGQMVDNVRGYLWGTQRRQDTVRRCSDEQLVRDAAA